MGALIACTNCGRPYPEETFVHRCPVCGGIYDFKPFPQFAPDIEDTKLPGIWRYRAAFGLPAGAPPVSLGEGNTPLVWGVLHGRPVAFKLEYLNPTGSFKDRGTSLVASLLKGRGIELAVEDSSGNAGASFAAYCARAGIKARIFIPDYASGPKRRQIEAYGAEVVRIVGRRSDAAEAVSRAAAQGIAYGSHASLPQLLPGYATLAYELVEQLGKAPGTVVLPAGQGGLLIGLGRGFESLHHAGKIASRPKLIAVQAAACAPLWAAFSMGAAGLAWVTEGETRAEGVRVRQPTRGDAVLKVVRESGGAIVAVAEAEIAEGAAALAEAGFYVEPTSAIVWDGIRQMQGELVEPVVAILTGSGLKSDIG